VCYGNSLNLATPRNSDETLNFDERGDIVSLTQIESLELSPMDEVTDQWGVAVMQLQASLPDTLPGQNVTFLLFGDVQIEDAADDQVRIDGSTLAATNVRLSPSSDGLVLGSIPFGTQVVVTGKTVNRLGEIWLRLKYEDNRTRTGWAFSSLIAVDLSELPDVASDSLVYNPMQAFYFSTGIGRTTCAEAPTDGILVQTPEGAGLVNLELNGIKLSLGSTALLTTEPLADDAAESSDLNIALIEGEAIITSLGITQVLVPGSESVVQVSREGRPIGAPARPVPMAAERLQTLRDALEVLPKKIDFAPRPATLAAINSRNPLDRSGGEGEGDSDGVCRDRNDNDVCDNLECINTDDDPQCEFGCRDRNGNGVCDLAECPDTDGNGQCDILECRQDTSLPICNSGGSNNCRDRNEDGICDNVQCVDTDSDGRCDCPDIDGDGVCDSIVDCLFNDGTILCNPGCPDQNLDRICDLFQCIDFDLDGVCDCADLNLNGVCDRDENGNPLCLPGNVTVECNPNCNDKNNDGICDGAQCLDLNGDGKCDCLDVNMDGVCDIPLGLPILNPGLVSLAQVPVSFPPITN
jgi:hypothetical protein